MELSGIFPSNLLCPFQNMTHCPSANVYVGARCGCPHLRIKTLFRCYQPGRCPGLNGASQPIESTARSISLLKSTRGDVRVLDSVHALLKVAPCSPRPRERSQRGRALMESAWHNGAGAAACGEKRLTPRLCTSFHTLINSPLERHAQSREQDLKVNWGLF